MGRTYFEVPTQVKFWDPDGDHYVGGIAYRDEIICGCCGGIFSVLEVCNSAPKGYTPVITYDDWIDIEKEIVGE